MVGKWQFYEPNTPKCDQICCRKFKTIYELGKACDVTCMCLCVFRVPSGAWWWVWWWVCVGWCWSLPSPLPDVVLWTRPLQCCAVSTTSISPYCSVASLLSWLLWFHCSHHRPPMTRCVHTDTVNNRALREVSSCKCFAVDTPAMLFTKNKKINETDVNERALSEVWSPH